MLVKETGGNPLVVAFSCLIFFVAFDEKSYHLCVPLTDACSELVYLVMLGALETKILVDDRSSDILGSHASALERDTIESHPKSS